MTKVPPDGWELNGVRVWVWAGSALLITLLCFALVGLKACVQRDWAFEDACQAVGGIATTMADLELTKSRPSPRVCVKSLNPLVLIPVKP